jgi:predicted nucleic acid-binding protein
VTPPHFLETNILLYSIGRDPGEAIKSERAIALLDDDNAAPSCQVLQEFYFQATRSTRADPLPHDFAAGLIRASTRFKVQDTTLALVTRALGIKAAHGFSYWDSAIIAAARAMGCARLYSEDMAYGRVVENVAILNPFR